MQSILLWQLHDLSMNGHGPQLQRAAIKAYSHDADVYPRGGGGGNLERLTAQEATLRLITLIDVLS